jgi:hypothetical protein
LFAGHFGLLTLTGGLFFEALNDTNQQQMAGARPAWLKNGAAQQEAPEEAKVIATLQEAPEELEVIATQQEVPEELDIEDKADDQPHVTYRLIEL